MPDADWQSGGSQSLDRRAEFSARLNSCFSPLGFSENPSPGAQLPGLLKDIVRPGGHAQDDFPEIA
jgi:hypothetical protein